MKIFREIPEKQGIFKNPVITIGSFDGAHIGHRKIFNMLLDNARRKSSDAIVLTFDAHPRKVLTPQTPPKILTSGSEKIRAIADYGIENIIMLTFTKEMSNIGARKFIDDIIKKIGIVEIIAGYDHAFGKNREGNIDFLREISQLNGIGISRVEPENFCSRPVSSTWIRTEIEDGNVMLACSLLGRKYTITGKVVRGMDRGQRLGFPTANIVPDDSDKVFPKDGVYAVSVVIDGILQKGGMLNIGTNPTFANTERTIEVNIFDFDENIYGLDIELGFHERIREERKFESVGELIEQLKHDRLSVQKILNKS